MNVLSLFFYFLIQFCFVQRFYAGQFLMHRLMYIFFYAAINPYFLSFILVYDELIRYRFILDIN